MNIVKKKNVSLRFLVYFWASSPINNNYIIRCLLALFGDANSCVFLRSILLFETELEIYKKKKYETCQI